MDTWTLQAPARPAPVVLPAADDAPLLVARRVTFAAGAHIAMHQHVRGQFLFSASGTMFVRSPRQAWLVPPSRALWLPAGTPHAIDAHGELQMRTLYLNAASAAHLPRQSVVLDVTPLLRELILRMTAPQAGDDEGGDDVRRDLAARLAVAEIARLPRCALELPMPAAADLLALCESFLACPSRTHEPAHALGGARTLHRRFTAETGLSFVQWRKQACLLHAVRLLSAGRPVTEVAFDLGYESPSAFTTMFGRAFGTTPRAFLPGRGADGGRP